LSLTETSAHELTTNSFVINFMKMLMHPLYIQTHTAQARLNHCWKAENSYTLYVLLK